MDKPLLIITSVGSEQQAITIAEELIQQELAACVNILPTMRSIYRFKGKVCDDEENLVVIKTIAPLFEEVATVIRQMHTYEVPEIKGFPIEYCPEEFTTWVNQSVMGAMAVKNSPEE